MHADLTQADVASVVGRGRLATVSEAERGVSPPPLKALPRWASALRVPPASLEQCWYACAGFEATISEPSEGTEATTSEIFEVSAARAADLIRDVLHRLPRPEGTRASFRIRPADENDLDPGDFGDVRAGLTEQEEVAYFHWTALVEDGAYTLEYQILLAESSSAGQFWIPNSPVRVAHKTSSSTKPHTIVDLMDSLTATERDRVRGYIDCLIDRRLR